MNFNNYNSKLRSNAHKLRSEMTKAEACLWKYALKGKRMKGYTFNRQRPILNFIADFMCKDLKLVIEVDGYSHFNEVAFAKDLIRQNTIENAGYKVIRFKDIEVLSNMKNVIRCIEITISEIEGKRNIPLTTQEDESKQERSNLASTGTWGGPNKKHPCNSNCLPLPPPEGETAQ